jgi:histidinol dehydrogenase
VRPDAQELIAAFRLDPTAALAALNAERGIGAAAFLRDDVAADAARASDEDRRALDELGDRLDKVNASLREAHRDVEAPLHGLVLRWKPIPRVGVYVPQRLASTAVTYLSAMTAAGVPERVVYLAQGPDGTLDPLCAYAAQRYRATTLAGPARLGFLALALGVPAEGLAPVDLLAGPCGRALNELKHLACLAGAAVPDMYAGPSAVAIVADETAPWERVVLDLAAQLEHGRDSTATLFVVGEAALAAWRARPHDGTRVDVVPVADPVEATRLIDMLAPETVAVWTRNADEIAGTIRCAGTVYERTSSSFGDYGAIGRGCADPTDGRARAQTGLLPGTFLRAVPVVSAGATDGSLRDAAVRIALREVLPAHAAAIRAAV